MQSLRAASTVFGLAIFFVSLYGFARQQQKEDGFITYKADLKKDNLQFYWKDDKGKPFRSIQNLRDWLVKQKLTLVFATNGGMYKTDNSPLGLYIQNSVTLSALNRFNGNGNFYLKPNGVFYITTNNQPFICPTSKFKNNGSVKYATQSGPMLLVDGQVHPSFKKGSQNLNIRNGVGILPDNRVVFVMSKKQVNLYDFADYFKKMGCKNALYLDGFVSRTYLPEQQWVQADGDFGVMIGVVRKVD
ncbi:phosphodiester glycosidase family protein [Foetidibacter luteolus]|uniref:phosphodiester glycosidase family protein n=1 Tax=Foetidibacter luteolus TaxID=2608880 RepID=UPI00129A0F29|nr:phosphodiester glycosidase family protein [Foetidibacter luteolus]